MKIATRGMCGAITLGGGGDTVNFRTGNQNLTFDTLAGATVTSTTPFAVSGNQVATIDPTPFAMADRNLLDFSRAVSSAIPEIDDQPVAKPAGGVLGFAGSEASTASPIAEDFAAIPGASAQAADLPLKSPTAIYRGGVAVWGRAFAGERTQQEDGDLLHTDNQFYGGMIGGGWQAQPNLRVGVFLGAGQTRSSVDFGFGDTKSDLVFGGVHGRYNWGSSFFRIAVQGGHSRNDSSRNINNNLAPNGLETAEASYDGWYISPEATYGIRLGLGSFAGGIYTLTPSLKLRYLYAAFDGYTESGSTANLTVDSRAAQDFEERAQLKLTRTQVFAPTQVLKTSIFGGVLGDQRVGDLTVDAALLGQPIPFATPGDDDVWGGFGGAGLEWYTGRVTLFASAEYLALSDSSSIVAGKGGLRVAF